MILDNLDLNPENRPYSAFGLVFRDLDPGKPIYSCFKFQIIQP